MSAEQAASGVAFREVTKVFSGGVRAVDQVSLTIEGGEFIVLVGPSGCGKTTLLRMVAGLEPVSRGQILIGGRNVTHLPPRRRDIAMVFQNYALYPHMSVRKNLGYGLKVHGMAKSEITRRVADVARMLGLDDLLDRRPAALSGGQRQRVAMGRAIVREPAAFLMDEPLSNLDAKLRVQMRAELTRLHNQLGITTIYVTHDQVEAMTLGQRVAVMREGKLQQVDTPQNLYRDPANLFVAAFIGSPSMNLVDARVTDREVVFAGFRLPLAPGRKPSGITDGRVIVGIRPQHFEDVRFAEPALPTITIEPAVVEELGSATHVIFPIDAQPVDTESVRAASDEQEATAVLLAEDRRALFTAEVNEATRAQVGEQIRLSVDPLRFHFFDPETGANLQTN
jgi:multiple sugar transport system ATP-binding protein